jgi:hypothetical protein
MTRTDLVMLWVWRNHARNLHIYSHVASPHVIKRITNWSSHTRHNNSNNNSAMRYALGLRASWIKKKYWGYNFTGDDVDDESNENP